MAMRSEGSSKRLQHLFAASCTKLRQDHWPWARPGHGMNTIRAKGLKQVQQDVVSTPGASRVRGLTGHANKAE